jgi:hypothetical protein
MAQTVEILFRNDFSGSRSGRPRTMFVNSDAEEFFVDICGSAVTVSRRKSDEEFACTIHAFPLDTILRVDWRDD